MKHVLVTGGAGLLGSHLCDTLLERGYAVTALDNYLTGRKENLVGALKHEHFELIEADICDPIQERGWRQLSKHGLFGVLHFACPASPVDFANFPFEILSVDSIGTVNTVDLAMAHRARYLLASTSEIYGDPLVHPQPESYWGNVNTLGPRSCYDEAKRFAEAYVSTAIAGIGRYGRIEKKRPYTPLNGAIVRIFNTYGPRNRPDDGRVVPELCIQALRGNMLTIHGDGRQTRSFCYVTDLIDGITRLFESSYREVFNIGNPKEYTVLEFAESILKITGSRSQLEFIPARQDDPKRRCPDITKAKTLLGWSPLVSLQEGLGHTLEYFKKLA